MSDLGNKEVMARNIKYYLKANDVTQTEMCNTLGLKCLLYQTGCMHEPIHELTK